MSPFLRAILGVGLLGCAKAFAAGPVAPPALLPEPEAVRIDKNRFISFAFPDAPAGTQWAVRVKAITLYNTDPNHPDLEACPPFGAVDFSAFEGEVRWVGTPEVVGNGGPGYQTVTAALSCCPAFMDWNTLLAVQWTRDCINLNSPCGGIDDYHACRFGSFLCTDDADCPGPLVNAYGALILPCSKYEVQLVSDSCPDLTDESCYSAPLTLRTALWGDVTPYTGGVGQPNFIDISYIVDTYRGLICFVKVQGMLRGEIPPVEEPVAFLDVSRCVNAYKRIGYPGNPPPECTDPCP